MYLIYISAPCLTTYIKERPSGVCFKKKTAVTIEKQIIFVSGTTYIVNLKSIIPFYERLFSSDENIEYSCKSFQRLSKQIYPKCNKVSPIIKVQPENSRKGQIKRQKKEKRLQTSPPEVASVSGPSTESCGAICNCIVSRKHTKLIITIYLNPN